jgi:hypothetical protein
MFRGRSHILHEIEETWSNPTHLHQIFSGDFFKAEMVKAFITSGEYRRRFGP